MGGKTSIRRAKNNLDEIMARIPLVSSKKARLSMFFDKMPASEAVKMQARTKRIRKGFGARKFK